MRKINLTRAFTLRKRLRTILTDISKRINFANVGRLDTTVYPDDKVVKSTEKDFDYKGLNLQDTYELLLKGNDYMLTLNNLIDKANVEHARPIINELENEKSKISLLKNLSDTANEFTETKTAYENVGTVVLVTRNYVRTNDYDWNNAYNECKKNVVKLEDKLSEVNATTMFDVPEEIINFVSDNI